MTDDNQGTKDNPGGNKPKAFWENSPDFIYDIESKTLELPERDENSPVENTPVLKSVPSKKKYHEIRLRLTPEREQLLKDCCLCAGEDASRIEDHSGVLIWDLLLWLLPMVRMRSKLLELYGPILREGPEREKQRR